MAQQINLLTPILMAPKRYFSALAMLKAIALVGLGALALTSYLLAQFNDNRAAFQRVQTQGEAERAQLMIALTQLPSAGDPKALQQQLDDSQSSLARSRQMWAMFRAGQAVQGQRHSDLLHLLASSTPASVWLSELRWSSGVLEIDGATLDPDALRAWLAQIAGQPLLRDQHLATLKITRADADGAAAQPARSWNFTVRSEVVPPASRASGPATRKAP